MEKVNSYCECNGIPLLDKGEILMVGDSLTSDTSGAVSYGLKSCLFDPSGDLFDKRNDINYKVKSWYELGKILSIRS